MVSFDIMQAVFNAYQTIWRERFYLLRLGTVPFAIAYLNFVGVSVLDFDLSPLRRSLLLFPAMVVEAWFVCQFLRTLMTGERWPFMPIPDAHGRAPIQYTLRVRGLLSGIIFYTLVMLSMNVFAGTIATLWEDGTIKALVERGDPLYSLANFIFIFAFIRGFKYAWMHVPLILNLPIQFYVRAVPGWMPSVHLIGLWLAAAVPIMAITLIGMNLFASIGSISTVVDFIIFMLLKLFDTSAQFGIALTASTAAAFALRSVFISGVNRHV